jgi:hypothetical protein
MRKFKVVTAVGFCLAILVITGIPQVSDAGVIYACVDKRTGAMRMVSSATRCTSKETAVSWNQEGPAGPTGATGATGPQGPAGVTNGVSRVIKGYVNWDGTVISGTGFSVSYDSRAPGGYSLTFVTPFTSVPSCVVTPNCDPILVFTHPELTNCMDKMADAHVSGLGTDGMSVTTEILLTNAQGQATRTAASLPFSFICAE